jgi:rRNA maturation endonuclease Nob1
MIRATQNKTSIVRETTAKYSHVVDGEIKTEEIRVRYRSLSIKALREQKQLIADKKDDAYISDTVFAVVEELPDFVDEKDKPIVLTLEFFEEMNLDNLKAIKDAIDGDVNPELGKQS